MNELVYKFAENEIEYDGVREVRQHVFVEEQEIPENLVFGGDPGDDENLVVVLEGTSVIGTARIVFPSHDTAKIERMAVLGKYRNRGVGRKMMAFMVSEIKNQGLAKVYLHAQYTAVDFYKSCGFRDIGKTFKEAGIKHIKMELDLFDIIPSDTEDYIDHRKN
ncbi:MAG TPA: GNAT family N-acetyltransferase [Dehalococcoidia bacterium]|nr:GNAT family N-acetyltransferase [Dehalococcoidia bacterium]